jgi:hypothetical protein
VLLCKGRPRRHGLSSTPCRSDLSSLRFIPRLNFGPRLPDDFTAEPRATIAGGMSVAILRPMPSRHKLGMYSAAIETRPRQGDLRRLISREWVGRAACRAGLFGKCSPALVGRSYNQDRIRTGLRLRSHIVDRRRTVCRNNLFPAG